MQRRCHQRETGRIGDQALGRRLGAMRPAMGEAEQRSARQQNRQRRPCSHRHERDQNHDRGKDHRLDPRKAEAGMARHAACDHRADEAQRQRQQGATPDLGGQQADGDHCQHVIGAADRVDQSAKEPTLIAAAMGKGGPRHEQRRGNDEKACHVRPPAGSDGGR